MVIGVLVALNILGQLVKMLPDLGSSSTGQQSAAPAAVACPSAAAKWLPNGGSGAVLAAQYHTDKHVVTLCADTSGQYWYDGQVMGAPADKKNHIVLPAVRTGNGFSADNKGYVYEISGLELVQTNKGKTISRMRITQVAP